LPIVCSLQFFFDCEILDSIQVTLNLPSFKELFLFCQDGPIVQTGNGLFLQLQRSTLNSFTSAIQLEFLIRLKSRMFSVLSPSSKAQFVQSLSSRLKKMTACAAVCGVVLQRLQMLKASI
jgi:hypothetical protein